MADDVTLRSRRSRKHRAGDHSLCRPERCPVAGTRKLAEATAEVVAIAPPDAQREVSQYANRLLADAALVEAYQQELAQAERLATPAGAHVMRLVLAFVGSSHSTPSALAQLSKELRAAMAEAMKGAPRVADAVDELQAARRRRRSA